MENKKRITCSLLSVICLLIVCALFFGYILHRQQTYFQRLNYEDVSSIHIYSRYSMDGTLQCTQLSDEDARAVFQLINQISLSGLGRNDFREYTGVWLYGYRVTLNDGKTIEVAPNGSLLILNQKRSFRIDYDLGTALGELRADLDKAYFLNDMLP